MMLCHLFILQIHEIPGTIIPRHGKRVSIHKLEVSGKNMGREPACQEHSSSACHTTIWPSEPSERVLATCDLVSAAQDDRSGPLQRVHTT